MKINDYPEAIATLQRAILGLSQTVRKLKDAVVTYDREIDNEIAFDATLKNDTQRKAHKAELQAVEDYQALLLDLRQAEDKKTELEIELELLRSQFSIAKLERRESIAAMELAASQQAA